MKAGFVTLIGRLNIGKSTLVNHLIGQKIVIISEKVQTTRNQICTVYAGERGQIVPEDTPGLTRIKNKLGHFMVDIAEKTIEEVDVILWIVDVNEHIGVAGRELVERFRECCQPLILAVNKIDKTIDKARLAAQIKVYEGFCRPKDLVAATMLESENVGLLLDTLYRYLPERSLFYNEDTVIEEPMREFADEPIREQTLRLLRDEVPHGIAVTVERIKERGDGGFDIDVNIICEREPHKDMMIGKGGQMLERVGIGARRAIEEMTESKVNSELQVKVRHGWRDNDTQLRPFGCDIEKV